MAPHDIHLAGILRTCVSVYLGISYVCQADAEKPTTTRKASCTSQEPKNPKPRLENQKQKTENPPKKPTPLNSHTHTQADAWTQREGNGVPIARYLNILTYSNAFQCVHTSARGTRTVTVMDSCDSYRRRVSGFNIFVFSLAAQIYIIISN